MLLRYEGAPDASSISVTDQLSEVLKPVAVRWSLKYYISVRVTQDG